MPNDNERSFGEAGAHDEDELEVLGGGAPLDPSKDDRLAVQALANLPNASEAEAMNIGLALEQLIRGMNSIQVEQNSQRDQIAKLHQAAAARDASMKKFVDDQQKFLDDVKSGSEALEMSPAEKEKLHAQQNIKLGETIQAVMVEGKLRGVSLKAQLDAEPKETITVAGQVQMIRPPGEAAPRAVIYPEVLSIGTLRYTLQPGVPTEVPRSIAQLYRTTQRDKEQSEDQRQVLDGANTEASVVKRKWQEIDAKYSKHPEPEVLLAS